MVTRKNAIFYYTFIASLFTQLCWNIPIFYKSGKPNIFHEHQYIYQYVQIYLYIYIYIYIYLFIYLCIYGIFTHMEDNLCVFSAR